HGVYSLGRSARRVDSKPQQASASFPFLRSASSLQTDRPLTPLQPPTPKLQSPL
uniref:Uncharacterized protein n=1 Tax=Aegilops tauschii subsp. strangulata TaxID=200361 RepID=A0A453R6N5_AEGTS